MPSVFLDDFPEPDRIEGAPHPRETAQLFGHRAAQAEFLEAFNAGRLHHAWLIAGPRGVGKATLAWRIARFLMTAPADDGGLFGAPLPPATLDPPPDHPALPRIAAMTEPGLFLLRRGLNEKEIAPASEILVKEVRALKSHFTLSAADGGRRVAIIDAADEMNVSAANALLKLLEEPPQGVTFLLIAHQPNRLLPTIRSRCRMLRLSPLSPDDLTAALAQAGGEVAEGTGQALAELADGSVGEAFRLSNLDGLALYGRVVALFATLPRMDRRRAIDLAETAAGKGAEGRFDLIVTLIDRFLSRLARAGSLRQLPPEAAPDEAAILARLAPTPQAARGWADLAQGLALRARRGRAVNLDPAALLMDMVLQIDETAGTLAQR